MAKPKNYDDFNDSLKDGILPSEWPEALKALWFDANGDWKASHDIAQDIETLLGSWIHAYLHRKEGDEFNAGYWYRRAQRNFPDMSLTKEHQQITEYILNGN